MEIWKKILGGGPLDPPFGLGGFHSSQTPWWTTLPPPPKFNSSYATVRYCQQGTMIPKKCLTKAYVKHNIILNTLISQVIVCIIRLKRELHQKWWRLFKIINCSHWQSTILNLAMLRLFPLLLRQLKPSITCKYFTMKNP